MLDVLSMNQTVSGDSDGKTQPLFSVSFFEQILHCTLKLNGLYYR